LFRIHSLGGCNIGDANAGQNSYILLDNNEIGDGGGVAFGNALISNHSLEVLLLNYNRIGDQGAMSIANGLKSNLSLKQLSLGGNVGIGDRGVSAFCQMLKINCTLRQLGFDLRVVTAPRRLKLAAAVGRVDDDDFDGSQIDRSPQELATIGRNNATWMERKHSKFDPDFRRLCFWSLLAFDCEGEEE